MAKISKRNKKNYDGLNIGQAYALTEAVKEVKKRAISKFKAGETVEVAMNLDVDPTQGDQNLRGMISLPHGTGKTCRVAVFAKGPKAEEAKKAGADVVGDDSLVQQINEGKIDFDRCVATPDMMGVVGKVAKILGPKGLMPNPKLGTVTMDVAGAVKLAKAGQIEYRVDKAGIIHAGVAKSTMSEQQILENVRFFIDAISKTKPASIKGAFIKKITLSSTMGPGLKVDVQTLAA